MTPVNHSIAASPANPAIARSLWLLMLAMETDIDRFVNVVAPLEPTFGGINLEDIKAPECFEIEEQLRSATFMFFETIA